MTYSEKMLQALSDNNWEEAQDYFEKALQKDQPKILAALGEELYQLGFIEEAKKVFLQLLNDSPKNTGYLLSLGEIAIEEDRYDEAFQYFDEVPKDSEDYPSALLDQADLYQMMEMPDVAELKLLEAKNYLPEEPLIQFALGELYYSTQQFVEAASYYLALLMENQKVIANISIEERLGVSYDFAGKFEKAIPHLENALKLERTDDRLFYLGYTYEEIGENEKAIEIFEELLDENEDYDTVYLHLGKLYQKEEQIEQAQGILEKGIEKNPYQVDLYLLASENSYRLKEEEKAISYLEKALTLGEKEEEILQALGNLYLRQDRFNELIALYEKQELQTPQMLWDLGRAYYALEEYDEAFKAYSNAYQDLKEEPDFMREYGLFLREEGYLEDAKKLLTHYLEHEPLDLEIQSIVESFEEDDFN